VACSRCAEKVDNAPLEFGGPVRVDATGHRSELKLRRVVEAVIEEVGDGSVVDLSRVASRHIGHLASLSSCMRTHHRVTEARRLHAR
jgi:hypothetical protein